MSTVFIITPFGIKNGIDFTRVVNELIQPGVKAVGLRGGTTGEIIKQGNIRTDMFQKLLLADLVIADISIHNANVFYELGARHAFREKRTFLIRCSKDSLPVGAKTDEVPFDLKTDRYLEYRYDDLAGTLPKLIAALKSCVESEDRDSPIFQLLPKLEEVNHEVFLAVPLGFHETVECAMSANQPGDLSLLAEEASSFDWAIAGLRLVGHTLFKMARMELSGNVWEEVRKKLPYDLEANISLGTIYQRQNDLTRSNHALERALTSPKIGQLQRAEAHALRGRNAKHQWQSSWPDLPGVERRAAVLRMKHLHESYLEYAKGFEEDQNHFYSGLNALAMLTIIVELATALPQVWEERFDDETAAKAELAKLKQKRQSLGGAVEWSLDAEQHRRIRQNIKADPWFDVSLADLLCLTSPKPTRVASAYRDAITNLNPFSRGSGRKQLMLYRELNLHTANVDAALALSEWDEPASSPLPSLTAVSAHVIVFTGHRIDAPGRSEPRFPSSKEPSARARIKEKLSQRREHIQGSNLLGLAGGASGGDILFHEVCAELGIATELYLALPPDKFCAASVADSGSSWEERFYALVASHPDFRVLAEAEELPSWLGAKSDYNFWKRNNLWMLHNAVAIAGKHLTLLALWDGKGGDGPGGTEDMVNEAEKLQARTIVIDSL